MNMETDLVDNRMSQAMFKDFVLFKFKNLEDATNNFLPINKLGQGGFGPVYKVLISTAIECSLGLQSICIQRIQKILLYKKGVKLNIWYFLLGKIGRWTRNSCETTFTSIRTGRTRIYERSASYFETSTQKSRQTAGLLRRKRGENIGL